MEQYPSCPRAPLRTGGARLRKRPGCLGCKPRRAGGEGGTKEDHGKDGKQRWGWSRSSAKRKVEGVRESETGGGEGESDQHWTRSAEVARGSARATRGSGPRRAEWNIEQDPCMIEHVARANVHWAKDAPLGETGGKQLGRAEQVGLVPKTVSKPVQKLCANLLGA